MIFDRPRAAFSTLLLTLAAALLFVSSGPPASAQNTTAGAIAGTVSDSSGAAVPNAAVTITNQETKNVKSATTTAKGFYSVENLPDGDYTVAITASGFSPVTIKGIHLDPGQRRGQDVTLTVGGVESKVDVQADTIAVQTESSESGGTISAKEVSNLMLNGRNFQQLATLVPGVSSVNGTNQQVNAGYLGQTDLIVGGASSEETTYTIDGVYNMTPTSLININITPSIDAINEMRVIKNSYSARYGFAGSGQIVIETKSGTSQFHGTGYEFVRNNSLGVARPYSISGVPATLSSLHYNIYGFTLGGPIYIPKIYNTAKDKTFFFVGAEWKSNHYASVLNSRSEFTPAIRAGDLSQSHDAQACPATLTAAAIAAGCTPSTVGDRYLLCGPFCQSLLTARSLSPAICFSKDASGVTNQVNPACFDSASAYFINPANTSCRCPTCRKTTTLISPTYINTNPELDSQNDTIYRIDEHITTNTSSPCATCMKRSTTFALRATTTIRRPIQAPASIPRPSICWRAGAITSAPPSSTAPVSPTPIRRSISSRQGTSQFLHLSSRTSSPTATIGFRLSLLEASGLGSESASSPIIPRPATASSLMTSPFPRVATSSRPAAFICGTSCA